MSLNIDMAKKRNKNKMDLSDDILDLEIRSILTKVEIKNIILDFSCVNIIDSMGINAIIQVGPLILKIC